MPCILLLLVQRMNLIIKGDTSGVVEAIKGALQQLPQESVVLRYLLSAAGDITTSDVDLAAASGGMIVGFNLNPDEAVLAHAKRLGESAVASASLGFSGFLQHRGNHMLHVLFAGCPVHD